MKTVLGRTGWFAGLALAMAFVAPALAAQSTTMPSTLRYGSGLMDIPVASVLPHMTITGTYSGFFMDLGRTLEIDASGDPVAFGAGVDKFYSDASLAVGLFNRVELGATLQSFNAAASGGNQWGVFGRVQLLQPEKRGIDLAAGGRYVTAPGFADGVSYQPTRLGFSDRRFRESYPGLDNVNTELSLYGVASAHIRGFDEGLLPEHDLTFSLGYGTGMFQEGDQLSFYHADRWTRIYSTCTRLNRYRTSGSRSAPRVLATSRRSTCGNWETRSPSWMTSPPRSWISGRIIEVS